jgi:teichuronic acid biosynthesis glycosyltransferase TuaH
VPPTSFFAGWPYAPGPMDVAVLSSARWSSFRLSKHHIAQALARDGHEVLYVDPPLSPVSVLRNPARRSDLRAPRDLEVERGLRVWRPRVIPGQNGRIGQSANAAVLQRGLRARLPGVELAIAFSLESRGLLARLRRPRVYYCTDSFEDQPGFDRAAYEQREREMLAAADLVVGCSRPLCDQLAARGAEPLYLPHAIDDDSLAAPGAVPAALQGLPRPLVGWVGTINWRVDVRLLDAARRAVGDGTVVVIGGGYTVGASDEVRTFLASTGVAAVGEVRGEDLPTFLAALDVGLVPYGAGPFNRKSFPIKTLQYLAAGLPVVSTTNGATDELGDAVLVADEPEAFEAAVRKALEDDAPAAAAERRAIGRSRRWVDNARAVIAATR